MSRDNPKLYYYVEDIKEEKRSSYWAGVMSATGFWWLVAIGYIFVNIILL